MSNEFYDHGAVPATGSSLSSATMRAEFDAIEAGFDKLPTMVGQANKLVKVNAGSTGLDTTDAPDINGGTIDGAVIGGTTRAAGNFTTLDANGNVVLGDASTDTVQVNGYMGVGGAGNAAQGLRIVSSALTGGLQYGVVALPTATSSATTSVAGVFSRAGTEAAAFTTGNAYAFYADNSTKGAGSTITNQHGLYIQDQTQGTNNYGVTSVVSSGANKWNIYASGTANNYFAGNVQIGNDAGIAQSGKLDVFVTSTATYSSSSTLPTPVFRVFNTDSTTNETPSLINFSARGATGTTSIWYAGNSGAAAAYSGAFVIGNRTNTDAYTERLRIDSAGNVGIGTSSPTATGNYRVVEIESANATNGGMLILGTSDASGIGRLYSTSTQVLLDDSGSTSDIYVKTNGANNLLFGTNNTERLRIDSAGNVGIGTSSPGFRLDSQVSSTATNDQQVALRLKSTTTADMVNGFGATMLYSIQDNAGANFNIAQLRAVRDGADDSGAFVFAPYLSGVATERLRIDSAGNVGIGITAPSGYAKFATSGSVAIANNRTVPDGNIAAWLSSENSVTRELYQFGNGSYTTSGSQYVTMLLRPCVGDNTYNAGWYLESYRPTTTTGLTNYFSIGQVVAQASGGATQTERLRIDASGNLGLGVTPSAWGATLRGFDVGTLSAFADISGPRVVANAYFNGTNWIYKTTAAASHYTQTAGEHRWSVAPSGTAGNAITFTQVLAVEKDKSLALQGATSVTGAGISFPATQVASTDANTLDEYREGTFTPTIVGTTTAGTGTYSAQVGRYTRIGDRVYFSIAITWSAHTGTGNMRIGSLPFTSANITNGFGFVAVGASNLTYSSQLTAYVESNSTQCSLATFATGAALTPLPIDTAASVFVSGHYEV